MHTSWFAAIVLLVGSTAAKDIRYDCAKTPQICLNTCWAIKCQKNPATLHGAGQKDRPASIKYGDANRDKWGIDSKPCRTWGWTTPSKEKATSPDEYPYASSREAGQANFQKVVALRCVPLREQKSQGGRTRGIGTDKKTATWTTTWRNIDKLPQDWCGSKPTCKNDGHQFVSGGANGPFRLAPNPKKVRDIGSYSEDGKTAWVESGDVAEIFDDVQDEADIDGGAADAAIEAREADEEEADSEADIEARDMEE